MDLQSRSPLTVAGAVTDLARKGLHHIPFFTRSPRHHLRGWFAELRDMVKYLWTGLPRIVAFAWFATYYMQCPGKGAVICRCYAPDSVGEAWMMSVSCGNSSQSAWRWGGKRPSPEASGAATGQPGPRIGKPVRFRHCPRNGGECVTAKDATEEETFGKASRFG